MNEYWQNKHGGERESLYDISKQNQLIIEKGQEVNLIGLIPICHIISTIYTDQANRMDGWKIDTVGEVYLSRQSYLHHPPTINS